MGQVTRVASAGLAWGVFKGERGAIMNEPTSEWLTIEEAAHYLTKNTEGYVTASDVFRLCLDGKLKLSFLFAGPVKVEGEAVIIGVDDGIFDLKMDKNGKELTYFYHKAYLNKMGYLRRKRRIDWEPPKYKITLKYEGKEYTLGETVTEESMVIRTKELKALFLSLTPEQIVERELRKGTPDKDIVKIIDASSLKHLTNLEIGKLFPRQGAESNDALGKRGKRLRED